MNNRDAYIGKRFGNYQVVAKIACGSFGCVYLAHHIYLNRLAAIKLLHNARLHSRQEYNKFLQEAQLLEMLKHPHIPLIYEFGIHDGLPYMVTEYAPNGSLRNLLDRWSPHPLPLTKAIAILEQTGHALHYAHQQGVIHRDLKPENILFNIQGEVLLADFSIAIVHVTSTLRSAPDLVGTPAYMAPEQFRGFVEKKSDEYSLGCIGYELITGRIPFMAPTAAMMGIKHLQEQPVPPTQLNPHLPLYVEQAILKAMEKRRINRYNDVFAFITALYTAPVLQMHIPTMPQTSGASTFSKTKEQWLDESAILRRLQRYSDALAADEQAMRLDPNFAPAYNSKGNTLYKLKQYEEALAAYEEAIRLDPNFTKAYNNQGTILYNLKQYERALIAYEQAIRLDPDFAISYSNKGIILNSLERYEEALATFEHVIDLDPNFADAYYGKGVAFHNLDRYEQALAAYEQAIYLDPDFADAYNGKGIAFYKLGRYAEAFAAYERAIQIDADEASFHYNKSKALQRLGRRAEARQAYERARQLGYRG